MPKSLPDTIHFLRLRVDGDSLDEQMIAFFNLISERYVLVHHVTVTENPHYHAYVESRVSQANFSNRIKKLFNVSKSEYSNKACNTDRKIEYLSYLFNTKKGNVARLVTYKGFSPLDIETYRENAKTVAKEWAQKIKETKKTQIDIAMLVLERTTNFDPEYIYYDVISALKENRMMARPNHIRDIIATVMAYSENKSAKDQIKTEILRFFSRDRI